MQKEPYPKTHNNQMDVVIGLWKKGYIKGASNKR